MKDGVLTLVQGFNGDAFFASDGVQKVLERDLAPWPAAAAGAGNLRGLLVSGEVLLVVAAIFAADPTIGIVFGALLWAFLDVSRQILDLEGVSKEIVTIMQGIAVLSVVIAYEVVRRYGIRAQQREVGRQLAADEPAMAGAGA